MRTLLLITAAFAALVMVAPVGNAHAAPVSCMPNAPYGSAPQWAWDVMKKRGGDIVTSLDDPIWQNATCDAAKHTVSWRLPGESESAPAHAAHADPAAHAGDGYDPTAPKGPFVRLFQNHANDIALTLTIACAGGTDKGDGLAVNYCAGGPDKSGANFTGVAYAAQNMFVDPKVEVEDANRMAFVLHFTCIHGFDMGEAHNEFVIAKACALEPILRNAIGHAH
jgi:hypothetical protein